MKRIIISLLCIITVLCGYFLIHKKTAFINTRTETNSTQQPSAPSPLEQLKTQFKQPFKGRVFQELVSMSGSLNSILYCDTLDVAQRASILSKITNKPYSEMNALVSEVDRCISECCDSPCFCRHTRFYYLFLHRRNSRCILVLQSSRTRFSLNVQYG